MNAQNNIIRHHFEKMSKIDAFYSTESFFSPRRLSEEDLILCLLMIIATGCGAVAKATV